MSWSIVFPCVVFDVDWGKDSNVYVWIVVSSNEWGRCFSKEVFFCEFLFYV